MKLFDYFIRRSKKKKTIQRLANEFKDIGQAWKLNKNFNRKEAFKNLEMEMLENGISYQELDKKIFGKQEY